MVDRWWIRGNCLEIEQCGKMLNASERLAIFFPDDERTESLRAKQVCSTCNVKQQCLNDAISYERYRDLPQGIRGGMTGEERLKERRNRALRKRFANG
jgi:hypothetical protein